VYGSNACASWRICLGSQALSIVLVSLDCMNSTGTNKKAGGQIDRFLIDLDRRNSFFKKKFRVSNFNHFDEKKKKKKKKVTSILTPVVISFIERPFPSL
jgi:hypothetical protein